MNQGTAATGDASDGIGGLGGREGRGSAGERCQPGTITCRECDDEGVRDDHSGQAVIACPSCREILYRPVERSEPAL